jgi:hypothetical protein
MVQWSYSSLKDFINCPKQYYHTKVAQDIVKKDTVHTIYGKEVHKALESYVRDGTTLAKNYEIYKKTLDELVAIPGKKYTEYQMALTPDKQICEFEAPHRWVRGVCDLLIVNDADAYIVDYKTGNNRYADTKQLKLMALMTFAHFPEVQHIKAGLSFILRNSFVTEEYPKEHEPKLWADFLPTLQRLETAYATNAWPPQPSGLCGWCPVKTCTHHKVRTA